MNDIRLPHDHGEEHGLKAMKEQIGRIDDFQAVSAVFKQLGDPTRVRIFWLLCHWEECVINISAMLEMSSPAVSHHLRPLKDCGLIVSRRKGKEVYYRAADTPQAGLLHEMIEQVMEITCPKATTPYEKEMVTVIREIHDRLTEHLDERITIDDLARQYLINPTTLKVAFKSVYGNSIAAHMKEHRMEEAARMLRETDRSIADIARAVGYDSQSRFTSAFKSYYGVLPREYRK